MHVLLTNDDGYDSHGLRACAHALEAAGHQVTVVAPDGNRSATSHSITLYRPLVVSSRTVPGLSRKASAIDGTPTDCGKLALNHILRDARPDVMVSGINLGANIGANVFYSGTVGGAFEGVLAGIPSFALSVAGKFSEDDAAGEASEQGASLAELAEVARMSVRLMEQVLADERGLATGDRCRERLLLYNINFPDCPVSDIRGVKVVPQGRAAFVDNYEERTDPRGRVYYWLSGDQGYIYPPGCDTEASDDLHALRDGYIALTPLRFDLNCNDELGRLMQLELRKDAPEVRT